MTAFNIFFKINAYTARIRSDQNLMQPSQVEQCRFDQMIIRIFRGGPGDHDQIQPSLKFRLMQPVTLPDKPGDPVPHNAVADLFTD